MEPGHRFAPRLRRVDYSTLFGVVNLLVCSPACLPAAREGFCALLLQNAAGWPNAPGDGSTIQFPSPPLTCVSGAWRLRLRRDSFHPEQLTRVPGNATGTLPAHARR